MDIRTPLAVTLAAAVAGVSGAAAAQQNQQMQNQQMQNQQNQNQQIQGTRSGQNVSIVSLDTWSYDALYRDGLRADELMDADVIGMDDNERDEIGSVENVILDRDGQIVAIIAQVGGIWDIGDTHVAVPWDQVQLTRDGVRVPVNEDNVDDYGLYRDNTNFRKGANGIRVVDDDLQTGARTWKLSELVDDYAVLRSGQGYGYVEDAVFTRDGKLQAVVVDSDGTVGGRGDYAYPFYGYNAGWHPSYDYYQLPYDSGQVADMGTFDPEQMATDDWFD